MNISANLLLASRKPSTSSDAQRIDKNNEVNIMSIVEDLQIILKGNTIDDDKADKAMKEVKVDNAPDFNTI